MEFSNILQGKNREELEKLSSNEDEINEIVLCSEPIQSLFCEKELSTTITNLTSLISS
jgi:hypothetical protein